MAKCVYCGWDWFKHTHRNHCPVQPDRAPNDPKRRFKKMVRPKEALEGGTE